MALLRGLDIPGYFNGAARGILPPGDPHHFDRTRSMAFGKADVIVIVGTPFDFRMGYGKRINVPTLVQIDLDYRTVGKNRDIDFGIVGDPGAVLGAVLQAAGGRLKNDKRQMRQEWMRELGKAEDAALAEADADVYLRPVTDPSLPRGATRSTNSSPTTRSISAMAATWSRSQLRRCGRAPQVTGWTPARWDPWASAPDSAIAAKLAHPKKEVLCYYGDGAFGMTAFDMETADRFGAPFIAVIGNNSAMNQIRYGQLAKYGDRNAATSATSWATWNSRTFAKIWGGYGEEVREAAQIAPALRRARESVGAGKSRLINIWVDPNVYAPRHQDADDVQVTGVSADAVPANRPFKIGESMAKALDGRPHSGLHPRAVGPDLHAASRLVRRRRDQGRAARAR